MNAKKIVFPTDFSHCSDAAFEYATGLARESGGTLCIVHAEEPPLAYGGEGQYYGRLAADREELSRMLHLVIPMDPHVSYKHQLLVGDDNAADQIVEFVRQEKADLVVMGTHGRTGLTRMLMGSVAEAVVRRAPCPVLVMKQNSKKAVPVA